MSDKRTVHEPTSEQVMMAGDWHGGQASMLYAIASTGALSRGAMMPYDVTTVAEWNVDLLDRLHSELVQCAQEAKTGGPGEDDGPALREWADDVATVLAEWKTTAEQENER